MNYTVSWKCPTSFDSQAVGCVNQVRQSGKTYRICCKQFLSRQPKTWTHNHVMTIIFKNKINTYIINISAVRIQHLHRSWSELLHGPLYFCICAIIRILASFAWLFASQFSAIELLPGTMSTMSRSLKSELGKMLRGNSYRKHAKAHTIYLGGALVTLDIKQGGFGWVGRGFCFPTSDFWRFCEKKI